jgi:hypothetical protein
MATVPPRYRLVSQPPGLTIANPPSWVIFVMNNDKVETWIPRYPPPPDYAAPQIPPKDMLIWGLYPPPNYPAPQFEDMTKSMAIYRTKRIYGPPNYPPPLNLRRTSAATELGY